MPAIRKPALQSAVRNQTNKDIAASIIGHIGRAFVNHRFTDDGGAKRMNKVLGEQLDTVLEELNEAMWPQRGA